jgi:hypothetical protein
MQAAQVKVIRRLQLSQHLFVLLQVLELEVQTTQSYIQTSEQLKALVLLRQEMRHLDYISRLELHRARELVVPATQLFIAIFVRQVLLAAQLPEMKLTVSTSHQEPLMVLELELKVLMSSRFSTEPLYLQEYQHRRQLVCMWHQEEQREPEQQQLEMPLSVCIRIYVWLLVLGLVALAI